MSVTEYERQQLLAWFDEHMGPDLAPTMMELIPPVGWGDIVTKRDMRTEIARLDSKIDGLEHRLDTRLDGLEYKLDGKIAELRGEMGELSGEVHQELNRHVRVFATLLFASQAATVAIITLLITLTR